MAGQARRFTRYLDRAFEDVTHQIREKQAKGENVTQSQFLINLEGFSLAQQGCIQCNLFHMNCRLVRNHTIRLN